MRAAGFIVHSAIDGLFQHALGSDLRLFGKTRRSDTDPHYNHDYITEKPPVLANVDLFLFGSITSFAYHSRFPDAKSYLYYCHASSLDKKLQGALLSLNRTGRLFVIFPSVHKKDCFAKWFPLEERQCKIISPAVLPYFFKPPSKKRNGRILLLVNNLDDRVKRYPESGPVIMDIIDRYGDNLDIVGNIFWMKKDNPFYPYCRDYKSDITDIKDYSVAIFPLVHRSPQVAMMECMAMGVPVVTQPREGFIYKRSPAYDLALTGKDFCGAIERHLSANIKIEGKDFAKMHFQADRWKEQALSFIEGF